jgi:hypothetical protein
LSHATFFSSAPSDDVALVFLSSFLSKEVNKCIE